MKSTTRRTPTGEKKILSGLVEVFHANDPTRPVTQALFRPNVSHDYDDGLADMLDVVGQNYRENEILAAHDAEAHRAKSSARKTAMTGNSGLRCATTRLTPGNFYGAACDYLGESRRWPLVVHGSGLLDRTGAPRPVAFERQSWWSDKPMVFITRRIAPTDAMPVDPGYAGDEKFSQVLFPTGRRAIRNRTPKTWRFIPIARTVELFLNGKSLYIKEINADASPRIWEVPFAPGTLKGHCAK
jgi:beta-galactosidase